MLLEVYRCVQLKRWSVVCGCVLQRGQRGEGWCVSSTLCRYDIRIVCHDQGHRFLYFFYNKLTSICILTTTTIFYPYHMIFTVFDLSMGRSASI